MVFIAKTEAELQYGKVDGEPRGADGDTQQQDVLVRDQVYGGGGPLTAGAHVQVQLQGPASQGGKAQVQAQGIRFLLTFPAGPPV